MTGEQDPATGPLAGDSDTSGGGPAGSGRSRLRIALAAVGGLVALAAVAFGIDVAMTSGEVPRGVRIAGVEVGGLAPDEAAKRVRARAEAGGTHPVTVQAGDATIELVPADAGLGIDAEASVAAAGTGSLNPWTRLTSLFTTRDVPVVGQVDQDALAAAVAGIAEQVDRPVVEGTVAFEGGEAVPTWPQTGQRLDAPAAADTLVEQWADGGAVVLPVQVEQPQTDRSDVQAVLDGFARSAVAGPVTVTGEGAEAVLPPERIGEIVRIELDDEGALVPRFDAEAAQRVFGEQLAGTVTPAQDATVRLGSSGPEVVPSQDGRDIDWGATLHDWRGLFDDDRALAAVYVDDHPDLTTEEAEGLGIDEVIAEFTTSGFSYASGVNIRRVAQEVDGAVVLPGETFSLNGYTGTRGTAQGYVESGIILNGHADQAVGGGISQFATTLFNAAYFAGMQDAGHQEHSYYISRYPAGREATVYEGAIDLKFTNPSSTGVLIQASGDSDSVTVRIWGTKTVEVESVNGGRWNYTDPERITLSGEDCSPSSGAPGFTTSDTRIIRSAATGAEISRSTETTVYDPSPIVTCT
ncbi:VanW family protein [Tomitella gaofuii]|uniref:VanW family protein n=1 Tax=Tomitella gaofuii TaxID=2760083 RepID=UPI0015F94146|nr:VanW family protein [Tomitella gaofuii]